MGEPDADDTEAAWREIVENYGERAVVEPDRAAPAEPPPPVRHDRQDDLDHLDELDLDDEDDDEDGFVPPTPPPLPRSTPARTIAWIGVLGSPAVVLVLLLVQVSVPTVIGWLIIAAFIGGFGYLVATMDREPRDPWDDGSRV